MFKIGSLDSLMQLNEAAAKLDAQLDITAKKYEKLCFDNGATAMHYTDENEKQSMSDLPFVTLFSRLQALHQEL
jgi:hypothetical protein